MLYAPTALGGTLFSLASIFCLPSFLAFVVYLGDKYLIVCSIKVLEDMLTFSTSLSSPMSSSFPASLIFSSCIFESLTLHCLLLYQLYFSLVDTQYHFFPVYCPHYLFSEPFPQCDALYVLRIIFSLLAAILFMCNHIRDIIRRVLLYICLIHPDVQLLKFQCPVSLLVPSALIFPLYFERLFAVYLSPPYFFGLLISTLSFLSLFSIISMFLPLLS